LFGHGFIPQRQFEVCTFSGFPARTQRFSTITFLWL
jgi:hypothetical protein